MERLAENSELCQSVSALQILKKVMALLPLATSICHLTPLSVGWCALRC